MPGSDTAFGTLTINGDFRGDGGDIILKVALGDDNSAADRLQINGDASGHSDLTVLNRNGVGAQTNKGIEIISIKGKSNVVFRLKGDYVTRNGDQAIIAGAYAYTLHEGSDDASDQNWYLRSELTEHNTPDFNPAVPLYSSYEHALGYLNDSMIMTLKERTGERMGAAGLARSDEDSSTEPTPSVIWTRIDMAHSRLEPRAAATNHGFTQDRWRLMAGIEAMLMSADGGELYGSLWGDYVSNATRVSSPHGHGKLMTDGYGIGSALTWYDATGFYVDLQGHVTWYGTEFGSFNTNTSVANRQDALGYGLSAEVGQEFTIDDRWS